MRAGGWLADNAELHPPVAPGARIGPISRHFFAKADRLNFIANDAAVHEGSPDSQCPPITKTPVIFLSANIISETGYNELLALTAGIGCNFLDLGLL